MKIVRGYPPNYDQIKKKFNPKDGVVYTYGDTIYAPNTNEIPPDLMMHETTHSLQQKKTSPKEWWDNYLKDSKFRLSQELEAYRTQYKFIKGAYNRKNRRGLLQKISKDLSSNLYGGVITNEDALELIVEGSN